MQTPAEFPPQGRAPHALDPSAAFESLRSSPSGLQQEEADRRLAHYGPNEIEAGEGVSKLAILWAQVKSPLVIVLVVAAIISLAVGKMADAGVIALVIIANSIIGFLQEYRAEEALAVLKSRAAPQAEVLRECPDEEECIEMSVAAARVVPGDVILLVAGDKVPADARIFEVANLEVDESMLTGESTTVPKMVETLSADLPVAERTNLVYGGTIVTNGRGKALVYATGSHTQMGKIATLIQETEKVESPLQKQTASLGKKLGLLALGVAMLTLALGLWRGLPFAEIFLYALASAVSSIPEGLPAVMTITLAVGVNRMAKRNAIIRRLPAVDTLGAATVIVTDKTGTLTSNHMTVQEMVLGGRRVRVSGVGLEPTGEFESDGQPVSPHTDETLHLALRIGALCSDAHLTQAFDNGNHAWEVRGDPTEGALVVAAAKAELHKGALEQRRPRIDEIPFSSKTKSMATFHRTPEGKVHVYVKGAPETVLDLCLRQQGSNGLRPLTPEARAEIGDANLEMASRALRVLALAYQEIEPDEVAQVKRELENGRADLNFVGLVGMMDPPRPEVPEAVQRCKRAGIRVIMATGDHQLTGEAIARAVGILDEGMQVLTGRDLNEMTDEELDAQVENVGVFARVAPEHKHRIVEALRRQGHVVAMTGDGVNDAPALQAAEIGVAMGITGADVTKETAEMVLTDDNFASIVNAVEEGRVVFMNVRKVVKYLLGTNIGEDLTLLSALAFMPGSGLIITPVQILWINLVTDGILDVTLAQEPKEDDVMDEPPRRQKARIVNGEIMRSIVFVALFMALGTLWMFTRANRNGGLPRAQTLAFTTMAMFQVFNALNCRSRDKSVFRLGFFANRWLIGAVVLSVLLQIAANRVPFMQRALGTVPLSLGDWALIVAISSTVFIAVEIRKAILAHRKQRQARS
ncbi:MAG: HAD-IC family P-type ATPase [Anaerolineales bacterium]|nr:HAD-IC family P-type ATPase [Anaerolineales bacterium]